MEWLSLCPSPVTLPGEAQARPSQATNESGTNDSSRRICVGFASGAAHQGRSRGRDTHVKWSRSSFRRMDSFAVGTALTGGPPHRSQRALLTHWAPTSGHDAQSLFGIRVQCSMLDDFHQPSVVDGIEESTDVRVEYPVVCQNSAVVRKKSIPSCAVLPQSSVGSRRSTRSCARVWA